MVNYKHLKGLQANKLCCLIPSSNEVRSTIGTLETAVVCCMVFSIGITNSLIVFLFLLEKVDYSCNILFVTLFLDTSKHTGLYGYTDCGKVYF